MGVQTLPFTASRGGSGYLQLSGTFALEDDVPVHQSRDPVDEDPYLCAEKAVRRKDKVNRIGLALPIVQYRSKLPAAQRRLHRVMRRPNDSETGNSGRQIR